MRSGLKHGLRTAISAENLKVNNANRVFFSDKVNSSSGVSSNSSLSSASPPDTDSDNGGGGASIRTAPDGSTSVLIRSGGNNNNNNARGRKYKKTVNNVNKDVECANHLRVEIADLKRQIARLEDENVIYDTKKRDRRQTAALVRRFGDLYSVDRLETLDELDGVPELAEADELKNKLLFSVIVVRTRKGKNSQNRFSKPVLFFTTVI